MLVIVGDDVAVAVDVGGEVGVDVGMGVIVGDGTHIPVVQCIHQCICKHINNFKNTNITCINGC